MTWLSHPVVVERLRSAIAANGVWVLHEIDPQAILALAPATASGLRGRS